MGDRLSRYIEREQSKLVESLNGRAAYYLDRSWLIYLADPIVSELCATGCAPNILEVGCGTAKSLVGLLENESRLEPNRMVGTSLTELANHSFVRSLGIQIETGIVAEELPSEWTDTFQLVMACVVMGWTELAESVPEILRVLTPGGYFLGYEPRRTVATIESLASTQHSVQMHSANPAEIQNHVGFIIQKLT